MKHEADHLEDSLDLALELTFPASDPVAVSTQNPRPAAADRYSANDGATRARNTGISCSSNQG